MNDESSNDTNNSSNPQEEQTENTLSTNHRKKLYICELIDGELGRFITTGDDYFVGTTEDIVYARGDRIVNNSIVIPLHMAITEYIESRLNSTDNMFTVLYGVAYGGDIKGNNRYTKENKNSFCLIDGFSMPYEQVEYILEKYEIDKINEMVQKGANGYWTMNELNNFSNEYNIPGVPIIDFILQENLPKNEEEIINLSKKYLKSTIVLDENDEQDTSSNIANITEKSADEVTGFSMSKGIILRDENQTFVKKIVF